MKKTLKLTLAILGLSAILCSCERRCVCTYDDGSQDIMNNVYSKSECQDMEDFYNNDLNISVDCEYK